MTTTLSTTPRGAEQVRKKKKISFVSLAAFTKRRPCLSLTPPLSLFPYSKYSQQRQQGPLAARPTSTATSTTWRPSRRR